MISNSNKINNDITNYNHHIQTIPDSDCTKYYLKHDIDLHIEPLSCPINVQLPNRTIIKLSGSADLAIDGLSKHATKAHILPRLQIGNFLSIVQLCDDHYTVTFEKTKVTVSKHSKVILQGPRNHNSNLWDINLPTKPNHQSYFMISYKPVGGSIKFMHGACYSPCVGTWCKVIKKAILKHCPT